MKTRVRSVILEKSRISFRQGHGSETEFSIFLYKFVQHRSLIKLLNPLRFWRRTRGDICNPKSTPRYQRYGLPSSLIRRVADSAYSWWKIAVHALSNSYQLRRFYKRELFSYVNYLILIKLFIIFSAAVITQYLHNFIFSTFYIPWMLMYTVQ
jgi:hypothetical protein